MSTTYLAHRSRMRLVFMDGTRQRWEPTFVQVRDQGSAIRISREKINQHHIGVVLSHTCEGLGTRAGIPACRDAFRLQQKRQTLSYRCIIIHKENANRFHNCFKGCFHMYRSDWNVDGKYCRTIA